MRETGRHGVDAQALLAVVRGRRLREPDDGVFARGVRRMADVARLQALELELAGEVARVMTIGAVLADDGKPPLVAPLLELRHEHGGPGGGYDDGGR